MTTDAPNQKPGTGVTMFASPRSPAPAAAGGVPPLSQGRLRPDVPPPAQPAEDGEALFNFALLRELAGFVVHSVRRHRWVALTTLLYVTGAALAMYIVMPRTYYTETKLLAQRNVTMPVLSNPGRRLPSESDTPTRLASEAILNHTNLTAIVNATNLVEHWKQHRSLPARLRDQVVGWFSDPPPYEEQVNALVWLLNQRMWVNVGEGTVTIGITWPDPNMAYRIVQTAQENFLEERHSEELALISESIGILEEHAADVNNEIRSSLDSMAQVRRELSPRDPNPIDAAIRRAAPSREVLSTRSRLETVQRTIADIEGFRNRRLAEMQATLADQRNTFGPAHPQIESTQQVIRTLMTDSPQLVQLRREEQELRGRLASLGASEVASSGADPLLAAAAVRALNRDRADSLIGERQQYARSRLRIAVASYEDLLTRLDAAKIELQTARGAFKFRYGVLVPPQTPTRPVSPRASRVIGGGILLGVLLALFIVVALDIASGRILERWQIERALRLPVLGEVPRA